MGTRVAMIELAGGPPHILLADHLEGDPAVLVYRVENVLIRPGVLEHFMGRQDF
jgi:hypothetical protein